MKTNIAALFLFVIALFTLTACCNLCPVPESGKETTWVTLDPAKPPGTPSKVTIDRQQSDATKTTIKLHIYGFWSESKPGPDGKIYQKIVIPGLGSHDQVGAPDLPLARFNLAIPTNASSVKMERGKSEFRRFPDYLIWPQPVPALDHPQGEAEKFTLNKEIYSAKQRWPESDAKAIPKPKAMFRSIPATRVELWPVNWNPATGELSIATDASYTFFHGGDIAKNQPMTKERFQRAEKTFLNWEAVSEYFPGNFLFYKSDFLIIYPNDDYQDELAPFVLQKRTRGFKVTEKTIDDIGNTCTDIRTAIQNWEAKVPAWRDAYLLLVGDVDQIPLCTSPTGVPTDDLYASTDGDDLDEEIYVGRLSVDSQTDAANQINKILQYEDHPNLLCCYHIAGLWAHKEGAPGKYEGAHETVRTNTYSTVPVFETFYGSQAGVTDSDINNRVDSGVGVLAYRGHGNWDATATGWNQTSEYYEADNVTALNNLINRSPVVWSFACTNTKLDEEDAISEIWMEQQNSASVSYYGASVPSYTSQNHVLDEWMFLAVYDEDLVTQSHAIERAEDQMASIEGSSNAWMYLLLGDPDMQIRRKNPLSIKLPDLKEYLMCRPPCFIELNVIDERINPVIGALVGFYKPGIKGDEVFVNQYSDKQGHVKLEISPRTAGTMYYSVEDGQGNAIMGKVEVKLANN